MSQRKSLLILSILIGVFFTSCAPPAPEAPIPTEVPSVPPTTIPTTNTPSFTQTDTPTNTPQSNTDGPSVPLLQPITNPEPTSTHYEPSRIDAIPLGLKASLGAIDFLVADLIRPATEIVLDASSANPKPDEGMEYVFVDLIGACVGPRHVECWIKQNHMRLIGSTGIERRPKNLSGLFYLFESWHIMGGDTAYGWVAFIVAQNEGDLVFYYETNIAGTIYLSTE
ncbi:MAG: hypothetical protein PVI78_05985 [Anaerolineales bacterium]